MMNIQIPISAELLITLRKTPSEVERETRLALAIHWYAQGFISQGSAAQIAAVSRAEFLRLVSEAGVSPFQESLQDVQEAAGID